jgi:Protein of unknown function (DUF4231)
MSEDDYFKERVDQFQQWYDRKAVYAKSRFLRIRIIAAVGAVIVPVVANVIPEPDVARYVTTLISLIVSITVALNTIHHFGDQWKNYRATEQFLSREKFLFMTGEGPYKDIDGEKAFALLVDRCEAQIAAENSATLNVIGTAAHQPEPAVVRA